MAERHRVRVVADPQRTQCGPFADDVQVSADRLRLVELGREHADTGRLLAGLHDANVDRLRARHGERGQAEAFAAPNRLLVDDLRGRAASRKQRGGAADRRLEAAPVKVGPAGKQVGRVGAVDHAADRPLQEGGRGEAEPLGACEQLLEVHQVPPLVVGRAKVARAASAWACARSGRAWASRAASSPRRELVLARRLTQCRSLFEQLRVAGLARRAV